MDFGDMVKWAEGHPVPTVIIGAGGLIAILWMLGYIGGGSAQQGADQGTQNMAAAYYAAEAQQAVVGGQIQMATIQAAAATAINNANDNAAVELGHTQATAAMTINAQNVGGALGLGAQNLQATYSNNQTARQIAVNNAHAAENIAATNANAFTQVAPVIATQQAYAQIGVAAQQAQAQIQTAQANNQWWNIF